MNKRERDAIARKIERLTLRVGKKRDELREMLSSMDALIESVDRATDEMDWTVKHLKDAQRSLSDSVDAASEYA